MEEEKIELAKEVMAKATAGGKKLLLPVDVIVADGIDLPETAASVSIDAIAADKMALDIGPETIKLYQAAVADAKTVIWNGPVGLFEFESFKSFIIIQNAYFFPLLEIR